MCVYSIIRILRFQSNIIVICTCDMAGVRSGKTVTTIDTSTGEITGTTEYKYTTLSGKLVRVEYNTTILDIVYDESGQPFSIRYKSNPTKEGVVYYYVLNAQGDVVGLLNSSGELVVEYKYDPWGKLLETIIGVDETDSKYAAYNNMGLRNPLRYRGYIYDRDTGLYYLQSRYYDPEVGRFINADGFVTTDVLGLLSSNMFVYCENNPICKTDISGEATVSIFADLNADFLIGADIGLGLSFDDHGNVAIQWYYSHPFDEETRSIGLFDIGISAQFQITECETVDDLNGISSSSGFSVGSGLYAGVDITSNKGTVDTVRNPENVKGGFKAYVGYGAGVDVHEQQTRTSTLAKFSLKSIWRSIMDFLF